MRKSTAAEESRDLPGGELSHYYSATLKAECDASHALNNIHRDEHHHHDHTAVGGRSALAPLFCPEITGSPDPGLGSPGVFFDTRRLESSALSRRVTVANDKYTDDQFHDSESGDIYDLFNAVNGVVVKDGSLDISKLDEFTPKEAEMLNVLRLKEIWQHTQSGCLECRRIILRLNAIRGVRTEEESRDKLQAMDANHFEPIA